MRELSLAAARRRVDVEELLLDGDHSDPGAVAHFLPWSDGGSRSPNEGHARVAIGLRTVQKGSIADVDPRALCEDERSNPRLDR